MSIADVVQRADTRAGRAFDLCIIVLIVLSIVSLTIETLPGIAPNLRAALQLSEIVITVLFTAEYLLRVYTARSKSGYIFSFYGIIDLLAIVPFYLALGFDLRGLRAFRIFRVFRILKLTRYNRAMQRFHRALVLAKEELVLFFITTVILLYLAAFGIYHFEHQAQPEHFKSILHSIWWATTTLTTVGYGDIYPITAGGRTFTFLVLMIGLGVIAVPPGLVASALSKAREQENSADET